MVKYLAIIQARLNSSRLPAKVMLDLDGKTLLEQAYFSVSLSKKIDHIVVATSNEKIDDIIENKLKTLNIDCFRDSLNNVLERFYNIGLKLQATNIVRATADNPLMDGRLIDILIDKFESSNVDYAFFDQAVYGLSAEVFTFRSLQEAYFNAKTDFEKEHVTSYIKDHSNVLIEKIEDKYCYPKIRASIDTLEDYQTIQKFYLYCNVNEIMPTIDEYINYFNKM